MDRGWKSVRVVRQMPLHFSEHYRDTVELGTEPRNAQREPCNELGLVEGCTLPRSNIAGIGERAVENYFFEMKKQEIKSTIHFAAIKEI